MTFNFTQPVLLQIFEDEFDLLSIKAIKISAPAGYILVKVKLDEKCMRNIIKYIDLELEICCT